MAERYLNSRQAMQLFSVGKTKFHAMKKAAGFPPCVWFGPKSPRWKESDLLAYADSPVFRRRPGPLMVPHHVREAIERRARAEAEGGTS